MGGGADSIENYLSKLGGGSRPPKLAGGKPHALEPCTPSIFVKILWNVLLNLNILMLKNFLFCPLHNF